MLLHGLERKVRQLEYKMDEMTRRLNEMKQEVSVATEHVNTMDGADPLFDQLAQNDCLYASGLQRRGSANDSIAGVSTNNEWVDGVSMEPRLGECLPSVEPFYLSVS